MEIATTQDQEQIVVPSFKDWVINVIVTAIPLIGLIMLIIWAVDGEKRNVIRKRWASATLVVYLVAFVLMFVLWFTLFAALMSRGMLGPAEQEAKNIQLDSSVWNMIDSAANAIDSTTIDLPADTSGQ